MNKKLILLVSFNMYKGGSLTIYKNIEKFINQHKNIINLTFNKQYKFNLNSKIEFIYPIKRFNIFYRIIIEQIFVYLLASIRDANLIILLGNFPCILWGRDQRILFHNLLYIDCLKKPKNYGIKLFCESKFWAFCIKLVKPKIFVQTNYIKDNLENLFNFDLDIEILGAPIIDHQEDSKITKIPKNQEKFKPASNIKIDNNFFHLFYPAIFYPHKNHKFLFDCSDIFLKRNIKVHLTIDEKLIKNSENKQAFIFHKNVTKNDLIYLYKNTNALIYTSLVESLGMPLLEVTKYQKSVIAINLPYVNAAITNFYSFEENKSSLDVTLNKFKGDYLKRKNKIAKTIINIDSRLFFEKLIKQ